MAESLVNVDVLFDEECYKEIPDVDRALSYVRYFSRNVHAFRNQLIERGWAPEDINALIDKLWLRVIKGCFSFGIPLTSDAAGAAKRLGIIYRDKVPLNKLKEYYSRGNRKKDYLL